MILVTAEARVRAWQPAPAQPSSPAPRFRRPSGRHCVAEGRTNVMLDGRTVASYCWRTDSGVRPRSSMSRRSRRSKQTSSGVSTIHAQLVERQQFWVIQRKQSLNQHKRTCPHRFSLIRNADIGGEIVEWSLNVFSPRQCGHVCSQQRALNQSGIVEVLLSRARPGASATDRNSSCREGSERRPSSRPSSAASVVLPEPEAPAMPITCGGNGSRGITASLHVRRRSRFCFHQCRNPHARRSSKLSQFPFHLSAGFEDLLMAERRGAKTGGKVGDARDAQHFDTHVSRHDRLRHRGHAHQRCAHRPKGANLGRRLKAGSAHRQVDAFFKRLSPPVRAACWPARATASNRPRSCRRNAARCRGVEGETGFIETDQRIPAHHVDVVCDETRTGPIW